MKGLTAIIIDAMIFTAGKNPAPRRRNPAEQAKNRHNHLWLFYARHLDTVLIRAFPWRTLNSSVRAGRACSRFSTHFEPAALAFYCVLGGFFHFWRIKP